MYKYILIFITIGLSLNAQAQSTLEEILQSVLQNNPELQAHSKQMKAQKLGFKTGLTPENPEIEYVNSFSSTEGKPYEITVSQAFDFPTSYLYRYQISKEKIKNLDYFRIQKRQEVLLDAQLTCFEIIFLRKKNQELDKRAKNARKLLSIYEKRLTEGDATILELNKVKMEVANTTHLQKITTAKLANMERELMTLNGNLPIKFSDKDYAAIEVADNFVQLAQKLLSLDPVNSALQNEQLIAQKEISLIRAEALPKWSIGYRYLNSSLSESANGIKLGLSIPLWENKNKVKQSRQNLSYAEQNVSIHQLVLRTQLQQMYLDYQSLKQSLQDYQKNLAEMNTTTLLSKALELGEISSIEYFLEVSYYYDSYDTYLEIEHEYYKTAAKLNRFTL